MAFALMAITDAVAAHLRVIFANKAGEGAKGVRVGIKNGGCAGVVVGIH